MPFAYGDKIAVTLEELVPEFYPSYNALKMKLKRDGKYIDGMRRICRGGGVDRRLLIDYDTLPKHIKMRIPDPRKKNNALEYFIKEDPSAVRFFSSYSEGECGGIDPERQKQLVYDSMILQAAIDLKKARREERIRMGMSLTKLDQSISEDVNAYNEMVREQLRELSSSGNPNVRFMADALRLHNLPGNYRRLAEKMERYENDGYASLLRNYGNTNAVRIDEKTENLLNALFIQDNKPTPTDVARMYSGFLNGYVSVINPATGEEYSPSGFGQLSERTITAFLNKWEQRISTHLSRSANRQQYIGRYITYESLKKVEYSGSVISVDDRQPPFEYAKGCRMWFYNAIDLASECIMAFVWGKTKEGLIEDFYREIVRNCAEWGIGIPLELECESSLNSKYRETLLKGGNMFDYVRIIANKARSKRIERWFRELRYGLEHERVGWIGRPHAQNESYETDLNVKTIIPYNELVANCLTDIQTWNNMPHSRYPDKSRWEVFMENQNPDIHPINWHGILPYIGEMTHTSCRQGQIKLNGELFLLGNGGEISTGQTLLGYMGQIEGHEVDVRWLGDHQGKVLKALVYLKGSNRCVCEAVRKPVTYRSQAEAKNDPDALANREIMARYVQTIEGYGRRHRNGIEKLVVIDNRPRTVNNKFRIPYINTVASADMQPDTGFSTDVKVIETIEQPLNDVKTSREWSLKDNF